MACENVLYETEDRIARVTLNRPEKLNALSHDLLEEYADALAEAEGDREVRVVIVKGAGRAFSAGYGVDGAPRRGLRVQCTQYHPFCGRPYQLKLHLGQDNNCLESR